MLVLRSLILPHVLQKCMPNHNKEFQQDSSNTKMCPDPGNTGFHAALRPYSTLRWSTHTDTVLSCCQVHKMMVSVQVRLVTQKQGYTHDMGLIRSVTPNVPEKVLSLPKSRE